MSTPSIPASTSSSRYPLQRATAVLSGESSRTKDHEKGLKKMTQSSYYSTSFLGIPLTRHAIYQRNFFSRQRPRLKSPVRRARTHSFSGSPSLVGSKSGSSSIEVLQIPDVSSSSRRSSWSSLNPSAGGGGGSSPSPSCSSSPSVLGSSCHPLRSVPLSPIPSSYNRMKSPRHRAASWSNEFQQLGLSVPPQLKEFSSEASGRSAVEPRVTCRQESITYEESIPVIVRRRGCTMTLRIVSVEDVELPIHNQTCPQEKNLTERRNSLLSISLPQVSLIIFIKRLLINS